MAISKMAANSSSDNPPPGPDTGAGARPGSFEEMFRAWCPQRGCHRQAIEQRGSGVLGGASAATVIHLATLLIATRASTGGSGNRRLAEVHLRTARCRCTSP